MKVDDGCGNNEFKRNYKKLQKAAILCWNGGTSKPYSHRWRCKFREIQSIYSKEKIKILEDEIKLIVQQNNLAYNKHLQTKTIGNETEYKHRRAIAKI